MAQTVKNLPAMQETHTHTHETHTHIPTHTQLPDGSNSKESACNAGDTRALGSIPGSGRSPGGENGNPLQYSCLENSMAKGASQATARGVTKGRTQLQRLSIYTQVYT